VAVLHSALTPARAGAEHARIAAGEARVVVGARSAVFAAVPTWA
jgi:primosomal protein N' (replication factor Y)